mmetsp:Transcript_15595/g.26849  ORF Transcript_15595/g.26849 Transcript_15595/m.26849 type:complete len:296 (-) Transcript_15595:853-1740(-)
MAPWPPEDDLSAFLPFLASVRKWSRPNGSASSSFSNSTGFVRAVLGFERSTPWKSRSGFWRAVLSAGSSSPPYASSSPSPRDGRYSRAAALPPNSGLSNTLYESSSPKPDAMPLVVLKRRWSNMESPWVGAARPSAICSETSRSRSRVVLARLSPAASRRRSRSLSRLRSSLRDSRSNRAARSCGVSFSRSSADGAAAVTAADGAAPAPSRPARPGAAPARCMRAFWASILSSSSFFSFSFSIFFLMICARFSISSRAVRSAMYSASVSLAKLSLMCTSWRPRPSAARRLSRGIV